MKPKLQKRQYIMFIAGLLALVVGVGTLSFFAIRKISRDIRRERLIQENVSVEIPALHIRAPILEGTDNEVLSQAAGHFPETGSPGHGNYCIAGHSSAIYKEYFNSLKNAETGMEIRLYDKAKHLYTYKMTDMFIVEPNETWILNDFGDDRVTIVTCTDDGTQRRIVVGELVEDEE